MDKVTVITESRTDVRADKVICRGLITIQLFLLLIAPLFFSYNLALSIIHQTINTAIKNTSVYHVDIKIEKRKCIKGTDLLKLEVYIQYKSNICR